MPDRVLMPAGRTLTEMPLGAAGLETIRQRGRRRRWRRTGTRSGITLIMAAVVVLAYAQSLSSPRDRLELEPAEGPPATVRVPSPAQFGPGGASVRPDRQPVRPVPQSSVGPLGALSTAGPSPDGLPKIDPPATRRRGVDLNCVDPTSTTTRNWCLTPGLARRDPVAVELTVCRSSTAGVQGELRFPSSQEVDFTVIDSQQRQRWTYDPLITGRPATTEVVQPGGCVRFSVPWSAVDEAGRPLPTGAYTLHGRIVADDLSHLVVSLEFTR